MWHFAGLQNPDLIACSKAVSVFTSHSNDFNQLNLAWVGSVNIRHDFLFSAYCTLPAHLLQTMMQSHFQEISGVTLSHWDGKPFISIICFILLPGWIQCFSNSAASDRKKNAWCSIAEFKMSQSFSVRCPSVWRGLYDACAVFSQSEYMPFDPGLQWRPEMTWFMDLCQQTQGRRWCRFLLVLCCCFLGNEEKRPSTARSGTKGAN